MSRLAPTNSAWLKLLLMAVSLYEALGIYHDRSGQPSNLLSVHTTQKWRANYLAD